MNKSSLHDVVFSFKEGMPIFLLHEHTKNVTFYSYIIDNFSAINVNNRLIIPSLKLLSKATNILIGDFEKYNKWYIVELSIITTYVSHS